MIPIHSDGPQRQDFLPSDTCTPNIDRIPVDARDVEWDSSRFILGSPPLQNPTATPVVGTYFPRAVAHFAPK